MSLSTLEATPRNMSHPRHRVQAEGFAVLTGCMRGLETLANFASYPMSWLGAWRGVDDDLAEHR